jgi:hypothetical protein
MNAPLERMLDFVIIVVMGFLVVWLLAKLLFIAVGL